MAKTDTISALSVAFIGPLVEAFLAKHPDWSATRLGREALKDPGKVGMMRRGTQVRTDTARRLADTIERAAPGFVESFVKKHAAENLHA